MIITIMADKILDGVRSKALGFSQISIAICSVAFLLICSANFISHIPQFLHDAKKEHKARKFMQNQGVQSELQFIKQYATAKDCLIVSKRQAIYNLELGLASPIKGPGLVEIIRSEDKQLFLNELYSGDIPCVFLGIDSSAYPYIKISKKKLTEKYAIVAENSEHSFI